MWVGGLLDLGGCGGGLWVVDSGGARSCVILIEDSGYCKAA